MHATTAGISARVHQLGALLTAIRRRATRAAPLHPASFEEEAAKAGVASMVPRGVMPIRVRRIVGSAGKAERLDLDFLPLDPGAGRSSYKTILSRMEAGEALPPISVYQLGYRYFVLAGHAQVAAAKKLEIEFLDAEVTEALPRKDGNASLTYYARREFEEKTHLRGVRLTAPWRYDLLLRHIEGYRLYLEQSWGRSVSLPEAASVWHRTQYLPTLQEISRRRLPGAVPDRTAGDVYTDILEVWAAYDAPTASFREMLDHYEQSLRMERSWSASVRTLISALMAWSLPRMLTRSTHSNALAAREVEAELEGLYEHDGEQGEHAGSDEHSGHHEVQ